MRSQKSIAPKKKKATAAGGAADAEEGIRSSGSSSIGSSAVARHFEEIRQSIDLRNSVHQIRESRKDLPASSDDRGIIENRNIGNQKLQNKIAHINSQVNINNDERLHSEGQEILSPTVHLVNNYRQADSALAVIPGGGTAAGTPQISQDQLTQQLNLQTHLIQIDPNTPNNINRSPKEASSKSPIAAAAATGDQPPPPPTNQEKKSAATKEAIAMKDDHRIPLLELQARLETDLISGLTSKQAESFLAIQGENKLSEKKKTSIWLILFKELTNGFALLLWAGAILCFIAYGLSTEDLSNLYLGIVIIIVIAITTIITYQQNARSQQLMDSFKNFLPQKCTVLRDGGQSQLIEAKFLVVGDIVLVKAGEKIPADIRIIESNEMKVDNSPLTGESEPLLRTVECSHPENYLETSNVAFFGTLCKEGQGKGIVIATGDRTTLGQIADLSSGETHLTTPLRKELNRFVIMITIISVVLGVLFFLLALLVMGYKILLCITLGIGILVANVPEGLLGCITISLAITAKNLSRKQVLVKNLEAVETLGSTSCICSDKTGTLTQNVMSVKHIWFNDTSIDASLNAPKKLNSNNQLQLIPQENRAAAGTTTATGGQDLQFDQTNEDFKSLHQAAMISSEAKFDVSNLPDSSSIDYEKCPVIGDATETGLIRFYQRIEDVNAYRSKYATVVNSDGTTAKMPFNSQVKFALTVVQEHFENSSEYTIFVKGAPEKIWTFCSSILSNGQAVPITDEWVKKFKSINLTYGKNGERVLGFARIRLPSSKYPVPTTFTVSSVSKFNFKLDSFTFCGLVSLMDPPKTRVPAAILECRSAGIKVIMVTGDQPPTAAAIAREVNIIPKNIVTNEDILEEAGNAQLDWFAASENCEAIVVHGDRISESIDKAILEGKSDEQFYLRQWVKKPFCVFARTTPAQKLQIVKACQKEGYIVAATGDGVNDSPAIKQADIGISMNLSGSDVTKDAADMILLDDDFASIVIGVEEGRKIFDNLKKTVVYLLTSNVTEIVPFFALLLFNLPLPLSPIFMLIICVGTDIWPALSLAYEEAELDVMTRAPRSKEDHLVSGRLLFIAYMQTGMIATAAGFAGYFITFNYFGFPVNGLFGMAKRTGYRTKIDEFNTVYNPILSAQDPHFNSKLYNVAPNCNDATNDSNVKALVDELMYDLDWFAIEEGRYDLRKVLLKCDASTGNWVPDHEWDVCQSEPTTSIIPNSPCFSTEAIRWAQSSYFVCVVFVQWSNIFACKSRKTSFTTTLFNRVMIYGIIFETLLTVFLLYVPGIQSVFGGRPLPALLFGVPGFLFSVLLLVWEESRKYLTRTSKWFLKHTLW